MAWFKIETRLNTISCLANRKPQALRLEVTTSNLRHEHMQLEPWRRLEIVGGSARG